MSQFKSILQTAQVLLQMLAMAVFALTALGSIGWSVLATAGIVPWLVLPFADPADGVLITQVVVIGIAVLSVSLFAFLPGSVRVMRLENSHRKFSAQMEDVAYAYHTAHAADRAGVFQAKSEFDAVKERMIHMRDHPELAAMEPEILELAAQMSRTSDDLARIYSDENVARAHDFLNQRNEEVERFTVLLDQAKAKHAELRTRLARVELDEAVMQSELNGLRDELRDLLPELDGAPSMPVPAIRRNGTSLVHAPTFAAE